MMEQLFAQQGQGRVFLAMLLGGLVVAGLAHGATLARRTFPLLAVAGDLLVALALLAVLLCPVLYMETPLRLYGLLGVVLGAALYAAGVMPVTEALLRRVKKCLPGLAQKEGNPSKGAKT